MFEEIHHFGITIHNRNESREFYSKILRIPLLAETTSRGSHAETTCRLREAVNHISWYQIGDAGMETFHLPRHPSRKGNAGDVSKPGYRYIAFRVDNFEDYIERLGGHGLEPRLLETCSGRCAAVQDPDGVHVLLFESGRSAVVGHITGLKEAGIMVGSAEGYDKFFEILGLWRIETKCDFLEELFGIGSAAPLYGGVRIIPLDTTAAEPPQRCLPSKDAEPAVPFSVTGIKHVAYRVEDIDAFHARCSAHGIRFLFEPQKVSGGSRIAYFLDPEGNTFEAIQINPAARALASAAGVAEQAGKDLLDKLHDLLR